MYISGVWSSKTHEPHVLFFSTAGGLITTHVILLIYVWNFHVQEHPYTGHITCCLTKKKKKNKNTFRMCKESKIWSFLIY